MNRGSGATSSRLWETQVLGTSPRSRGGVSIQSTHRVAVAGPLINKSDIPLWCSWLSRSAVKEFIDTERSPARFRSRGLIFFTFFFFRSVPLTLPSVICRPSRLLLQWYQRTCLVGLNGRKLPLFYTFSASCPRCRLMTAERAAARWQGREMRWLLTDTGSCESNENYAAYSPDAVRCAITLVRTLLPEPINSLLPTAPSSPGLPNNTNRRGQAEIWE